MSRVVDSAEHAAQDRLDQAIEAARTELKGVLTEISGSIRKIRAAGEPDSVLTELVHAAARCCRRAAVLLRSGETVIGFRAAGGDQEQGRSGSVPLSIQLASAPAIAHATESKETVVTEATQHNLSQALCKEFAYGQDEQVTLYPLVLRDTVLGVLLVDGNRVREDVIEAMILTAEAWIEALGSRPGNKDDGDRTTP